MSILELQNMFTRALSHTFSKGKWLLTSIVLILCALLILFFKDYELSQNSWTSYGAFLLSIFISLGILFPLGLILIKAYREDVKGKKFGISEIIKNSWDTLLSSSYAVIGFILTFIVLWVVLGLYLILAAIPALGDLFKIILASIPFLLCFGIVLLFLGNIATLFVFSSTIAFLGLDREALQKSLFKRFQKKILLNIWLLIIALIPALLVLLGIYIAMGIGHVMIPEVSTDFARLFQSFFIAGPAAMLLAPAVIFFFNFAAESHVYTKN